MFDKLRNRLAREEKGFTLIELLVVVIILGILTAIAIPSYLSFKDRATNSASESAVRSAVPVVEEFYADNNTYSGMDATTLGAIDSAIDWSKYTFGTLSASTYCIQYGSTGHEYFKDGPTTQIAKGTCS